MASTTHEPSHVATRLARPADAPALAELHMQAFPADVSDLTPLGAAIVRRFYASALERGLAQAVLATDSLGRVLGYVLVTPDIAAMFPGSLLRGPGDIARFLVSVHPIGFGRALWTKLTSGTAQVAAVPELVYLAVSASARGRGVGAVLMGAAHDEFRRLGIRRYELNVHADNESAVKLYQAQGLTIARRYSKGGRDMFNMVRELSL